jgi:hypothetical protein
MPNIRPTSAPVDNGAEEENDCCSESVEPDIMWNCASAALATAQWAGADGAETIDLAGVTNG